MTAKEVKNFLKDHPLFQYPVVNGIGTSKKGDEMFVKVNLTKEIPLSSYPTSIDGIAIQYEVVGEIVALEEPEAFQKTELASEEVRKERLDRISKKIPH